jgi:transposase-like protein
MKTSKLLPRARRTDAARRAQLLAAFERSGLSAAAFARQHGLRYTTFCGWRQRRTQAKTVSAFVQVELAAAPAASGLVLELGDRARLRIESASQLPLAAQLLHHFHLAGPC